MMRGLNLTSEQLGNGFPFNYSELLDPEASLLGFSNAGGAVLFDEFTKTVFALVGVEQEKNIEAGALKTPDIG